MKSAPFGYCAPTSIDGVLDALGRYGPEARLLAGGQSLVPAMAFRTTSPQLLIDVNGVAALGGVEHTGDVLRIGAIVRHDTVNRDPVIGQLCPALAEAAGHIATPAIRHRGTIGGSLAFGDPLAELATVLTAMDASVEVRSRSAIRTVPVAELSAEPFRTVLAPDEMIVSVQAPVDGAATTTAFHEIARRRGHAALAAAAARITVESGLVSAIRVAAAGVVGSRLVQRAVTAPFVGGPVTGVNVSRLAEAAADSLEPFVDVQTPADYRRALIRISIERSLAATDDRLSDTITPQVPSA